MLGRMRRQFYKKRGFELLPSLSAEQYLPEVESLPDGEGSSMNINKVAGWLLIESGKHR